MDRRAGRALTFFGLPKPFLAGFGKIKRTETRKLNLAISQKIKIAKSRKKIFQFGI
jgi:hypothetical protein